MTRINTNTASLNALRNLTQANKQLNLSLERLSSGFKINRGSDAPAGLVISERLRAQLAALRQATDNTQRASNMVSTAESALNEVTNLLVSVKDLALEAANTGALSAEEVDANQAQIDSAVETINRIANTTKFSTLKLLNGNLDYVLSTNTPLSALKDLGIFGLEFGNTSVKNVQVVMTGAASVAHVIRTGGTSGTMSFGSTVTLQISGNKGTEVITIGISTTGALVAAAVNAVKEATGVSAVTNASSMHFYSTEYGTAQFVSVTDLDTDGNNSRWVNKRDVGRDAVIKINGVSATTRGLEADLNTQTIKMHVRLHASLALNTAKSFDVHGGGAKFQVGDTGNTSERVNLGIQQINSFNLGSQTEGFLNQVVTGGRYDLRTNPGQAAKVLDAAIDDITVLRARLGAFDKNILQSQQNTLGVRIENLSDAQSRIRDTDFAAETANFTRSQILVQAGTAILAQANLTPQSVLALLGGR